MEAGCKLDLPDSSDLQYDGAPCLSRRSAAQMHRLHKARRIFRAGIRHGLGAIRRPPGLEPDSQGPSLPSLALPVCGGNAVRTLRDTQLPEVLPCPPPSPSTSDQVLHKREGTSRLFATGTEAHPLASCSKNLYKWVSQFEPPTHSRMPFTTFQDACKVAAASMQHLFRLRRRVFVKQTTDLAQPRMSNLVYTMRALRSARVVTGMSMWTPWQDISIHLGMQCKCMIAHSTVQDMIEVAVTRGFAMWNRDRTNVFLMPLHDHLVP